MIAYPEIIPRIIEIVGGRKVFGYKYQPIYEILTHLWNAKQHIDFIVVQQKTINKEQSELVTDLVPLGSFTGNETYATLLVEASIKKSLGDLGSEISYLSKKPEQDAFELLEITEGKIFKVAQSIVRKGVIPSHQASSMAMDRIRQVANYGFLGVPTGIKELDEILGGMQNQDLIILAGRPSTGKTALGLDILLHAAHSGFPGVVFTAEMSAIQLSMRAISHESGINFHKFITGRLTTEEMEIVSEYAVRTGKLPIFYEDSGGISVSEIRAKCRRLKHEHNIALVVVDYLQLISSQKRDTREQEVAQVSRTLKAVAKELDVPVLCLSQLSRLIEQRTDKRPILSDLRESGAIEQDADVVLFVHSPSNELDSRDIIVAKQRNGPLGEFTLYFDKATSKFHPIT